MNRMAWQWAETLVEIRLTLAGMVNCQIGVQI